MKTKIFILIAMIFTAAQLYSQNITNTLGTGGTYFIKDAGDTLLQLKSADGYIGIGIVPTQQFEITKNFKLPETTDSTKGVLYKGSKKFIHNFAPAGTHGLNTFIGTDAGNFTMAFVSDMYDASYNTGVGHQTLKKLSTGFGNTSIGTFSMSENTSGSYNAAIGNSTLRSNTTGSENSAIGSGCMYNNLTGTSNTAIGNSSLFNNATGNHNTAVGSSTLVYNETGSDNTVIGYNAMVSSHVSSGNTAVGKYSLVNLQTGINNVSVGINSALTLFNGSNNILIGNNATTSTGTTSNQITLGNNQISSLRCNVQSITSLSDMRDKKNIAELSLGLDFISKLKPRQFNWDKREWYENNISDGSKTEEKLNAGFIAQELDEVQVMENADWLGLVNKDNPEKIEATYGNLLPVMVKAIQELKSENDELKKLVNELSQKVVSLPGTQEAHINSVNNLK